MTVRLRKLTELEKAERIARHAHAQQLDPSGDPYIEHVERVVALVAAAGESDAVKAVAWLHDVIEDTAWTRTQLVDRGGISEPVAEAVEVLSRREGESYEDYIRRVVQSRNPLARPVKLADLRDHLRPNCPVRLRPRYELALTPFLEDGCEGPRQHG